jgi:hypothetical protein
MEFVYRFVGIDIAPLAAGHASLIEIKKSSTG